MKSWTNGSTTRGVGVGFLDAIGVTVGVDDDPFDGSEAVVAIGGFTTDTTGVASAFGVAGAEADPSNGSEVTVAVGWITADPTGVTAEVGATVVEFTHAANSGSNNTAHSYLRLI